MLTWFLIQMLNRNLQVRFTLFTSHDLLFFSEIAFFGASLNASPETLLIMVVEVIN